MTEKEGAGVSYSVAMVDGVVKVNLRASIDIIEVLDDLAKDTSNTIDDRLVDLVRLAKDKADWAGHAREHIL